MSNKILAILTLVFMQASLCFGASSLDHEQINALMRNLKSFQATANLSSLKDISGILVIGSSGSGKTTLLNTVRSECSHVTFPKRYITRPKRANEDHEENIHISISEFERMVANKEIEFFWIREMEEGRREYYGFEKTEEGFSIFSGNNATLSSPFVEENKKLLIIGVIAPDAVRTTRLATRSPDLSPDERTYRITDPHREALKKAHILVSNYEEFEATTSKFDLVTFIRMLPSIKKGWGEIKDLGGHAIEYRTRLFDVMTHKVRFSDGIVKTFQYVRRSPGVRILLTSGSKILITAEWRTEAKQWDFRLPGGKVFERIEEYAAFRDSGSPTKLEDIGKLAAAKELGEECGISISPETITHAHTSTCGATVEWDLLYYIAPHTTVDRLTSVTSPEGERIIMQWLSFETVLDLCTKKEIGEDRTAAFLMRYILTHKK